MQSFVDKLPDLPQIRTLTAVVERLKGRTDIMQIWLGGSFAAGTADRYSDIDLRLSVDPATLGEWGDADLPAIFEDPCPGTITMVDPGKSVLHHVLLSNGELFDLYVQPFPPLNVESEIVPLGGDTDSLQRLENAEDKCQPEAPASGSEIERAIRGFWVNTHKHRKVLDRDLDLLAYVGLRFEHDLLRRLWLIDLSGFDEPRNKTIHTLTCQMRTITNGLGEHAFRVVGRPLESREQLVEAIEAARSEVATVGRRLAGKLSFDYPADLEAVVLAGWEQWKGTSA